MQPSVCAQNWMARAVSKPFLLRLLSYKTPQQVWNLLGVSEYFSLHPIRHFPALHNLLPLTCLSFSASRPAFLDVYMSRVRWWFIRYGNHPRPSTPFTLCLHISFSYFLLVGGLIITKICNLTSNSVKTQSFTIDRKKSCLSIFRCNHSEIRPNRLN